MQPLRPQEILAAWERAGGAHPVDRALTLLAYAMPGAGRDVLAGLTLGRRDRLLLELRCRTFGERLRVRPQCLCCGERLEFELTWNELCAVLDGGAERGPVDVQVDGFRVQLRLPDSFDLAAAAQADGPNAARRTLFERCVTAASRDGEPAAAETLPDSLIGAAAAALGEADPWADVSIDLSCPSCGHAWSADLDAAAFLWTELAARAERLLFDVHRLASAYGWSEAQILALPPARRELYVQMAAT